MANLKVQVCNSISDINKNQWNNVVKQSELGSFFHRYEWLKTIEEGIGLEPKHIVVLKNKNILGIFPNFIQSIPKTPIRILCSVEPGFGGPLMETQEKHVLDLMIKKISHICKGNIILHHIRTPDPGYIRYEQYFEKEGYRPILRYCGFEIDLKNKTYEDVKGDMSRSKRQRLDKISKKDIKIKIEEINYENLRDFYEGYVKVMKRVGSGAYPFQFFKSLKNEMQDEMKIFTAIVDGKKVGRHLYLLDKNRSILYALLLDIDSSNFKYNSSELIHDFALK